MDEHTIKSDTETGRKKEQVNNIKHIVYPTPNKSKELPQYCHQFCFREKLPMAWGVPQQTARHKKSIPSQYARETKHLILRDIKSYLIPND